MATYGALAIGAPLGLSLYAGAGLALPALLVVLLPIIASGVIYGIPGNIPTARPRVPVLRVVGWCGGPEQGLCSGHWFCHPKRVYRPLVQRASLG